MKTHGMSKFSGLLLVACTALSFTGCQINGKVIGLSDYHYADEEKYTAGEAELASVENIEINWMVGNVTILPHDSDTVSFSETSERELTENMRLRYWLDNATLRVQFCACGKYDFSEMDKDLTVLMPQTLMLGNLEVNALSADVKITDCAVTQLVKVNTVSGNLNAEFKEPLNEFEGDSTSGSFTVSAPGISRFDVESISGEITLSVQKEPDWLDIDTTSGNVKLVLPESASFTLDYDSTSGDLSSDLVHRTSAGKYIFGDGEGEYKIETVSGDVQIKKGE